MSDPGDYHLNCADCELSETFELYARRDLEADRHERDTDHTVDRTPESPDLLTDGGESLGDEVARSDPTYGVCPNGHGDESGIIAAEESFAAREYANCPLCGRSLQYADACLNDHSWCVGPEGPDIDGEAWGGKCSTCKLNEVTVCAE
jgi:hypothetical protein